MMRGSSAWVALGVLVVGLLVFAGRKDARLHLLDRQFAAWIEANTPEPPHGRLPVVLVEIDQQAIDLAGGWPWRPLDYALFLRAVEPFKPSAIVIDHPPTWVKADRRQVATLENWALRTPRLLMACQPTANNGRQSAAPPNASGRLVAPVGRVIGPPSPLTSVEGSLDFAAAGLAESVASAPLPPWVHDGTPVDSIDLLVLRAGVVLPTLPLEAARLHFKVLPGEITALPAREIELGAAHRIPLADSGRMPVDFGLKDQIPRISYGNLLVDTASRDGSEIEAMIRDRIVVYGRNDAAAQTIPTITGRHMSNAELLAVSLATLTTGAPPMPAPPFAWLLLTLALCLFAPTLRLLDRSGFFCLLILLACGYFALATGLLYHRHLLLPLTLPTAVFFFLAVAKVLTSRPAPARGRPPADRSS